MIIFFKNLLSKYILLNKIKETRFLNFRYKKKDLDFQNKNFDYNYYN